MKDEHSDETSADMKCHFAPYFRKVVDRQLEDRAIIVKNWKYG